MKLRPLHQSIAERIENHIAKTAGTRLPTMHQMADSYEVSIRVVSQALAYLREKGIVAYRLGQPVRIIRENTSDNFPQPNQKAAMKLFDILVDQIRMGTIRSGESLPKQSYLAAKYAVSNHTVISAMKHLAQKGLVYKWGRQWIAGTRPGKKIQITSDPLTILILQNSDIQFRELTLQHRTAPFCRTFTDGAQRAGIQIKAVLHSRHENPDSPLPAGMDEITKEITQLGSRWCGTLIISSEKEIPDLDRWVEFFSQNKKPVVWFDRYGERQDSRLASSRYYTQCGFDETPALELALTFLEEMGHRHAGYVDNMRYSWIADRFKRLRALNNDTESPLTLTRPTVDTTAAGSVEILAQELRKHHTTGFPHERKLLGRLLDEINQDQNIQAKKGGLRQKVRNYEALASKVMKGHHTSLISSLFPRALIIPHLHAPVPTVLIAPSDTTAAKVWHWLYAAGVRIPTDISLISFDNYPTLPPPAVTSIDFGFSALGYAALHQILGDVPVKRQKNGIISTVPAVIRRGSVGRPRDHEFPIKVSS